MLTPAEFYAKYDSTDPFGNKTPPRSPNGPGHLGSDFPWAEGTDIPSFLTGTVTAAGWSSIIGWYIVVKSGAGWGMFYHLRERPPLEVGAPVSFGQFIGNVGNTGTASRGAHLHVGWSTTTGTPGTGSVSDPWPVIQKALGKEPTVQGWIYPNTGQRILADPIAMTYRYIGGWEADVFLQDGGVYHPLGDPEWSRLFSKYREIKTPDAAGVGASIDYARLSRETAAALVASGALNLTIAGTASPVKK